MLNKKDIKPGSRLWAMDEVVRQALRSYPYVEVGEDRTFIITEVEIGEKFVYGYFESDPDNNLLGFFLKPDRFDFDRGILNPEPKPIKQSPNGGIRLIRR